jgi:hypothetical protein
MSNDKTITETLPAAGRLERLTFTKKETQAVTGLSATSLWRLEVRGLLKPIPGIRHKIYSRAAVEKFVAGA